MSRPDWFVFLGVALAVLGAARLLLTTDLVRRVIALNVASSGVLMVLISAAHRLGPVEPDPVPHALALTGIVITISVTALALALIRRIEAADQGSAEQSPDRTGGEP